MSIKNIVNAQVAKVTQYNPTTGLVDGLTTSGNITANAGAFFIGDGGLLSNVASAYGNAEVSTYLASGTDTAGIDTAGDIDAGGNITAANIGNAATVLRGDGGLISNISVSAGTQIISGTTSLAIDGSGGNIDFTVAGDLFGTISTNQVAIGNQAGVTGSSETVALGTYAGYFALANTITIGSGAGQGHPVSSSLGANSIAIGVNASRGGLGVALPGNTIVLNATGANLNPAQANSFFVAPVRNDVANIAQVTTYNTTTKELTYANTISLAGNITGGNVIATNGANLSNVTVNSWTTVPQLWFVGKFTNSVIGTTQNADTLVSWNDVDDPQNWWVGGATARVTPARIGWYQVDYLINWTASGTAGTGQLNSQIRVNDVNVGFSQATNNETNQLTMMQSRMIYLANITDYFTFTVYTTVSGQTLQGGGTGCQASVRWIST